MTIYSRRPRCGPSTPTTGAAVSLDNMPRNVALGPTTLRIDSYEWGVTYAGMLRATDVSQATCASALT